MKSKSTGSKSSKSTTAKTKNRSSSKALTNSKVASDAKTAVGAKAPSNVVRLGTKASQKRTTTTAKSPAKLTAVKGNKPVKTAQPVSRTTARAVIATKVAVAERVVTTGAGKKAEVIRIKSESAALTLVAKGEPKVQSTPKSPMPKISRSEPSNGTTKVISAKFAVDSFSSIANVTPKSEIQVAEGSGVAPVGSVIAFKSGDKIVYPGHGVGEIEGIRTTVLGGQEHHIYNIKILDSGMKVMVPVSQASAVGLRKIVDKKAIEEVFSILKDRDFKIDTQTWNRRFREYSQKIKTGSVFEIAIVLRDLLVLSADKELSFGEKKMLDMAESLLVSEIAIAKARPHDKVVGELRALFA